MAARKGTKPWNWRGEPVIEPRGYVLIFVGKDHPLADCRGYAYEHRLKAEAKLGRPLRGKEEVKNPGSEVGKGTILQGDVIHLQKWPLPNVWLGVSTERQQEADERIPPLLNTPAAVRFISAEPLLGPIDLSSIDFTSAKHGTVAGALDWVADQPRLDWVIIGGESGGGYRAMDPAWAKSIIGQCILAGVPVFMKQMAGKKPIPPEMLVRQFPAVENLS